MLTLSETRWSILSLSRNQQTLLSLLAKAFLSGEADAEQIVARGTEILGRPWPWLQPLTLRYLASVAARTRPRHGDVVAFIRRDPAFQRAWWKHSSELSANQWLPEPQRMQPAAPNWDVPAIESIGALADWLWLEYGQLDWFADLKQLACKNSSGRLRHYHYRVLGKASGGVRLIEAPKPRLKKIQKQILQEILEKIPPHTAANGFLKRRSIQTFAAPHVGQRVVLRLDLQNFFVSIAAARIQTLFRTLGYPETVADLLGALCTNATPRDVWDSDLIQIPEVRDLYSQAHLPQGAPTSPALANLCAFKVDCRLTGLAQSVGAEYTRYADDLAFSGNEAFERIVERVSTHVSAILLEEGFAVRHRKTRIMRQGVRQHLAGLVTNQRLNIVRTDLDRLKATLTNCVRLGPETQNRDFHPAYREHLDGRIAFVESVNRAKAKRLRALFERIQW